MTNEKSFNLSSEQKCTLILGLIFVILGIAGSIPALVSLPVTGMSADVPVDLGDIPTSPDANYHAAYLRGFGYIFSLLPTNLLLNLAHFLFGIFGLYSATGEQGSFNYNRFFAIVFLLIAVLGLIPLTQTLFGVMPIFGGNVILNVIVGAIAAYYAFVWHPKNVQSTSA